MKSSTMLTEAANQTIELEYYANGIRMSGNEKKKKKKV